MPPASTSQFSDGAARFRWPRAGGMGRAKVGSMLKCFSVIGVLVVVVLAVLALPSCGIFPLPGEVACTDLAAFSVSVTVTDDAGEPVDDASVSFSVDNGAEEDCEQIGGGSGEYQCGVEIDGDFRIFVQKEGFDDVTREVTVGRTADDCHVEGEALQVTLSASDG